MGQLIEGTEHDTFEAEGDRFNTSAPVNIPLETILSQVSGAEDITDPHAYLQGDPAALENVSDSPPTHGSPRYDGTPHSEMREMQLRQNAEMSAALKNPTSKALLSVEQRSRLESILKEANSLPQCADVQTYVQGRKVTVDAEIFLHSNQLDRNKSLGQLQRFLQDEKACVRDIRHADGTVTMCPCPTHRVARCAQSFGFRDKPMLWLNQQLSVILQARDVWQHVPDGGGYDPAVDEGWNNEKGMPRLIAQLISRPNTELLQAATRGKCGIWRGFVHFVSIICDQAEKIRKPIEYTQQFDV